MPSVETVTVLISDLVGSTGLESRIGPGAADELRDEHFALLRSAARQKAELSREHGFGAFERRGAILLTTQSAAPR